MRVHKDEAIQKLIVAGLAKEARMLERWRNKFGHNSGRDGFMKRYPQAATIIW